MGATAETQGGRVNGVELKPGDYVLQYYLGLLTARAGLYSDRRQLLGELNGCDGVDSDVLHPEVTLAILDFELEELESERLAVAGLDEMRRSEDRFQVSQQDS